MLQEGGKRHGGMGKPPTELSIKSAHAYSLGLYNAGDEVRAVLIDATGQRVGAESVAPDALVRGLELLLEGAQVAYAQLVGISLATAAGAYIEETFALFGAPIFSELQIGASVRAERYFGRAQDVSRFLFFDAERLELGVAVGSTVFAQSGTLEALLNVAGEDGGRNLIPAAVAGAVALVQAKRVFVAGLGDDELGGFQLNLGSALVQRASEAASDPALAVASVPFDQAYSLH